MSDHFQKLNEATQIWTHPQFLVADVCRVTGATPKALEHFVNPKRELVTLVGPHVNPGTGRRRVFTGGQVLMIAAAYDMMRLGFPQRFSRTLADTVERRAINRTIGLCTQSNLTLLTYPMESGDWAVVPIYDERGELPKIPRAVQALDVDRLIDEVHAQLKAIVADEDVPDFTVPDPKPEPNPYSPASNFFRAWEKSPSGRWVYVGLTEEETDELLALQGSAIEGDELVIVSLEMDRTREEGDRYLELHDKHEMERLRRCGMGDEGESERPQESAT